MWQWPQLADLLQKGLRTVAFHQASFGAATSHIATHA